MAYLLEVAVAATMSCHERKMMSIPKQNSIVSWDIQNVADIGKLGLRSCALISLNY